MKYFLLLLLMGCCLHPKAAAQENWRKLVKKAETRAERADFAKAAEFYYSAWQQKKGKKEYLFRAGECYANNRDYQKASQTFSELLSARDKFPMAPFYYAQALKQEAKYEAAQVAFQDFMQNYGGADKDKMNQLVNNELEGCLLGLKASEELQSNTIVLENPGENINTVATEFAPVPFSDDILYFSSNMKKKKVQIFRSQRKAGTWTNSVEPEFPNMPEGHIGNGTFTPDGKRFYFTICRADQYWNNSYSECDIYVTRRVSNAWSEPVKLRDYIKMDGRTASQPYVTHIDGKEVLYYVTNRVGGKGGLDIWYTTREIESDDYDFTLPQNAGPEINTPGDEVSPYYDKRERTLYFSSNGHPSVGGLDIYKIKGEEEAWETAERLSAPYNSSADDYYYHRNSSGTGGFLVSNRLFDLEKIETIQDDIFTFSSPMSIPIVQGKLLDKVTQEAMRDVRVALYEIKSRDRKRLLNAQIFKDGQYEFGLIANRNYRLIATKRGYAPSSIEFNTADSEANNNYQFSLELEKAGLASSSNRLKEPVFKQSQSQKLPSTRPSTTSTASSGNSNTSVASVKERPVMTSSQPTYTPAPEPKTRYKRYDVSSDAPKHEGTYYKVQFTVVVGFNESDAIFDKVRDKGRLDTERIKEKGWTRVLLADFFSVNEARRMTEELRQLGFPDAFVVKYRNGRRLSL